MPAYGYRITTNGNTPLEMTASTLDEITSRLPRGFYTTFCTLSAGKRVLGLQAHLDRLYIPAGEIKLHPAVGEGILRHRIAKLAEGNLPRESRVRLILTKDDGEVYIGIQPFESLPTSVYRNGVHAITANVARHDPAIKDTGFIAESALQRKLVNRNVFEVLLTRNGKILEGMTSNFYAVLGGKPKHTATLVTARRGILLGVTRRAVLMLARGQGMSIVYRALRVDEPFNEAFITSSSRGVVPIVVIDDRPVGDGRVGAWTTALGKAYRDNLEARSEHIIPTK